MWNASVVEEVRVSGCRDKDVGEVGRLGFLSREEAVVLGLSWSYNLSEPCNSWEQGRRCLALAVDTVEDEYELPLSF